MLASLYMKVCLYLHFCLPGIWPSSTANESDHTEELYFGPVFKGSNWFCCCFVLANLVSSIKVTSGFQVNQNICFLCQIQTPAWKRGGWRKMCAEICQIMGHRASEWVMAIPTFYLFIYFSIQELRGIKFQNFHRAGWNKGSDPLHTELNCDSPCCKRLCVLRFNKQLPKSVKDQ